MTPAAPPQAADQTPFADGLGTRTVIAGKGGEVLELLRITPAFALVPRFEAALRERVARLANFRHAYFARVRRVDRLDGAGGLGIVSEHPVGARLSDVLDVAEQHGLTLDISAALCLIRQLVPAIATLHENVRDVAHGALAPERILVTTHARVVVTDHVLGTAIEQLRLSRERLWRDLQIAVPPGAGHPQLDQRADVMQLGVAALSLVIGRRLRPGDLKVLPELVASATEATVIGGRAPVSGPLRRWLLRVLQADPRASFETAAAAQQEFEEVLSGEAGYIAAPVALEVFLRKYFELADLARESSAAEADLPAEPAATEAEPAVPVVVPVPIPAAPPAKTPAPAAAPAQASPAPPEPVGERSRQGRSSSGSDVRGRDREPERPSPAAAVSPAGAATVSAAPASEPRAPAPRVTEPRVTEPRVTEPPPAPSRASTPNASADPPAVFDTPSDEWRPAEGHRWERVALVVLLVLVLVEGGVIWWLAGRSGLVASSSATVHIESRPAGLAVVVDGEPRGSTPVSLQLKAGTRVIELRGGRDARVLPLTIEGGRTYTHYLEMATTDLTGAIEIREHRGAKVLVNGELRGTAPLRIADLPPGSHEVVLETRLGRVRQAVDVKAGLTTTFGSTMAAGASPAPGPAAPATGHLRVTAPYEMQVFVSGRLLGTTDDGAFELRAGRHDVEVVSGTLAYRTTRPVDITGGRETTVAIELPRGVLTLDATPPADVWLDGVRLGETPLLEVPVTIGPHHVTFRHPDHGEQHHAIVVTAGAPARLRAKFE